MKRETSGVPVGSLRTISGFADGGHLSAERRTVRPSSSAGPSRSGLGAWGLVAHAFTDAAGVHAFHVELAGSALVVADRVPHRIEAVAARKVLTPSEQGFVEQVEFDRGLGLFETYYTMPLRRRHGGHERA